LLRRRAGGAELIDAGDERHQHYQGKGRDFESVNIFDCDPNGTLLRPLEVYGFHEYCFSSTKI
jgi:hypothetical protein